MCFDGSTYPKGKIDLPVFDSSQNPGRSRDEDFLKSTYGSSPEEVGSFLIEVRFLNQVVLFNQKNGAALALEKVGEELLDRSQNDHELRDFLKPWLDKDLDLAGMTFDWRAILGTDRLSAHSFGIAIDLYNPNLTDPVYWLWEVKKTSPNEGSLREDKICNFLPKEILRLPWSLVESFENHGFIWGGKWFHFDAIHFEYRPEFFDL